MKCLIECCEREANSRGLCWPCYQSALRLVKSGKTTWDELVNMGFVKKSKHGGKEGSNLLSAFNARRMTGAPASLTISRGPTNAELAS